MPSRCIGGMPTAGLSCMTIRRRLWAREYDAAEDWQNRIFEAARLTAPVYGVPALKCAMRF